jgi:AmmeMemoRadiSam system protein A
VSGGVEAGPSPELTSEEQGALLRTAREALEAHLERRRPSLPPPCGALDRRVGAFVTLRRREDDELRGCVGMMSSERPLVETVARMAVAAGTEDGRFAPVSAEECSGLRIEISALGPLHDVRPEDVEVGRDGLLISRGRRRGVLLPQVPLEHGWDRETFLDHTCIKAGLSPDTWRKPGVELLGFTAEVVGEEEDKEVG